MVNLGAKSEMRSFIHFIITERVPKFKRDPHDPEHAPFRGNLSSTGCTCHAQSLHQLWNAYFHPFKT